MESGSGWCISLLSLSDCWEPRKLCSQVGMGIDAAQTVKSLSKQSNPVIIVLSFLVNDRRMYSSPAVWSELLRKCTAGLMIAINPALLQQNLKIGNRIYCAGPEFCQFRFSDTVSLLKRRKSGKLGSMFSVEQRRLLVRPGMRRFSHYHCRLCGGSSRLLCNGLHSHPGPPVCSSC